MHLWTSDNRDDRALAKAACNTCPRLLTCHAQTETDRAKGLQVIGVSGGLDYGTGTKGHGRTGRPPKPIEHGTFRGYQTHRRRGEDPCDDCYEAMSAKSRADYLRKKEAAA